MSVVMVGPWMMGRMDDGCVGKVGGGVGLVNMGVGLLLRLGDFGMLWLLYGLFEVVVGQ